MATTYYPSGRPKPVIRSSFGRADEIFGPWTCSRCGFDWSSRVPYPKQCPECKSPYWDKPRQRFFQKQEVVE